MVSPDVASVIRPEDFPVVFRQVVRDIGSLVLERTAIVEATERQLLAVTDEELVVAQRRGRFSRADIENRVARDFAGVMGVRLLGSSLTSSRRS